MYFFASLDLLASQAGCTPCTRSCLYRTLGRSCQVCCTGPRLKDLSRARVLLRHVMSCWYMERSGTARRLRGRGVCSRGSRLHISQYVCYDMLLRYQETHPPSVPVSFHGQYWRHTYAINRYAGGVRKKSRCWIGGPSLCCLMMKFMN